MFSLNFIPPLQALKSPLFESLGLSVSVLRLDLNHRHISGNKWYKLKYNLKEAVRQNKKGILTFGGAFSNHIAATAAAGKEFGFATFGLIRGDQLEEPNPTLKFAKECGMHLEFLSRETYRCKNETSFLKALSEKYNDPYIIPEGGSNFLGIKGCTEIVGEMELPFDQICCACGTGTTLAGVALSLKKGASVLGFQILKGEGYIRKEVETELKKLGHNRNNWSINEDYHFGGYAKQNSELMHFIGEFEAEHGIPLDPVYTAKMMYGIIDLAEKEHFKRGQRIIALHTGGLQGISGFYET